MHFLKATFESLTLYSRNPILYDMRLDVTTLYLRAQGRRSKGTPVTKTRMYPLRVPPSQDQLRQYQPVYRCHMWSRRFPPALHAPQSTIQARHRGHHKLACNLQPPLLLLRLFRNSLARSHYHYHKYN